MNRTLILSAAIFLVSAAIVASTYGSAPAVAVGVLVVCVCFLIGVVSFRILCLLAYGTDETQERIDTFTDVVLAVDDLPDNPETEADMHLAIAYDKLGEERVVRNPFPEKEYGESPARALFVGGGCAEEDTRMIALYTGLDEIRDLIEWRYGERFWRRVIPTFLPPYSKKKIPVICEGNDGSLRFLVLPIRNPDCIPSQ